MRPRVRGERGASSGIATVPGALMAARGSEGCVTRRTFRELGTAGPGQIL